MITGECILYCYKSIDYFDRIFSKGKKYLVSKNKQYSSYNEGKDSYIMLSDNDIILEFEIDSTFDKQTLKKHFYTESQLRKQKLKKLFKNDN